MSTDDQAPQKDPAELVPHTTGSLSAVDPKWAWTRFEPSAATPWDLARAAHLFRRAGFGATWGELQQALARGPQATIDALIHEPEAYAAFADEYDRHEFAAARSGNRTTLVALWLRRMRQSPWQILEKLTLFWHEYFAIRSDAVADLKLTHVHVQLLRKQAFADLPALFGALANDPAMYIGLGGEQNRKATPNLHFAQPWLETFTIGPEATTSSAITNLARAWTGWFVYGGKLRLIERERDQDSKTLLGREGNLGRDDALQLLAEHPATAKNLARRLFRAFVSESAAPPDALLMPLAEKILTRASTIEVLEMILRSNLFFSGHAFAQRIKSPVELAVGLLRSLEGGLPTSAVADELGDLGQRLDAPPTVKGWSGGVDWLNTITMAARIGLCESLLSGAEPYGSGLDASAVATRHGFNTPESQARVIVDLLLPGQLSESLVRQLTEEASSSKQFALTFLKSIIARPEFQLS